MPLPLSLPMQAEEGGVVTAECGVVNSGRQDTRGVAHYAACGIEPNNLAARPSPPSRPSPPEPAQPV